MVMAMNSIGDQKKIVRLKAIRPLFFDGKRVEIGDIFEVQAQKAGEILATLRAEFAVASDRALVYKMVAM